MQVRERYSQGAARVEAELCCPVSYDTRLLEVIPQEIIERDYGCGDPSPYVRPGDTVLDLGSGGGKICYIAAQLVGPEGRVIGVDMNDDMLALARKYQPEVAAKIGGDRVTFLKGRIQDLALNLDRTADFLLKNPVTDLARADAFEAWKTAQRQNEPMVPDQSVDLVISNCVLNLVDDGQKNAMVGEIFRVLKPGGRVAIADIVADVVPPAHLKADAKLWSGCISGAFAEGEFVQTFRQAGFTGVFLDKWDEKPWRVEDNIEFRSVTLTAVKDKVVKQTERGYAVIYRGPFAAVTDDLGNHYPVGERIAVSEEVYHRLGKQPFVDCFIRLAPKTLLLPTAFTLPPGTRRPVVVTRGGIATPPSCGCGPNGC